MLLCGMASEVSADLKTNTQNQIREAKGWSIAWLLRTGVTHSHLGRVAPNPWDRCCDRLLKTGPSHLLVVKLHDVAINYSCYLVLALTDVPLFHCTVITS